MQDRPEPPGLESILGVFASQRDNLLPILQAVQAALGHVPAEAVARIAEHLNLSRAEVHGVVTFYHDFHESPQPGRQVRVCMAEACQSVGARQLAKDIAQITGCELHSSSPDGRYSVVPIYCLGLCACGPAVMVDGEIHGRVSPEKIGRLLNQESPRD
ncbi:MAG: formate dehydrogenase subunit gamma [Burkholderiaceae bacterium]|nr:formate dehydrogenase subunit gamma [Burkholderiaceae bacterium]